MLSVGKYRTGREILVRNNSRRMRCPPIQGCSTPFGSWIRFCRICGKKFCFHSWPHSQARKHETRSWNNANSPAPSAVRIRELGRSQKVAEEALAIETWHRAHLLARHVEARGQIKKARARIKVLEGALASAREENAAARNRYQAIVTSSAWKATAPLRAFGSWCLRLARFGRRVLNRDSTVDSTQPALKIAFWTWKPDVGLRTAIDTPGSPERGQGADEMAQQRSFAGRSISIPRMIAARTLAQ